MPRRALAACGEKRTTRRARAARRCALVLDYLPNPDHVGIYRRRRAASSARRASREDPTPTDPAAPLKLLAAGRADLAISYEPEVLLARDKGAGVLSVGAVAPQPLTSLMRVHGKRGLARSR